MAVAKVILNGTTLIDATTATAAASDITSPKTAMLANGVMTTGTGGENGPYSDGIDYKDVIFIDYDGTLLHNYTKSEIANMSALPANPTHTGLTSRGWNWTLSEINQRLADDPYTPITVGQLYSTSSGATEIDFDLVPGRQSPTIHIFVNGSVTVNWGDNSQTETVTGSSLSSGFNLSHTYSTPGLHTVSLTVNSGTLAIGRADGGTAVADDTIVGSDSHYRSRIREVRAGTNVIFGDRSFYGVAYCPNIILPYNATYLGARATYGNIMVNAWIVPNTLTQLLEYNFYGAGVSENLRYVSLPKNCALVGRSLVMYTGRLRFITISDTTTEIAQAALMSNHGLTNLTIPSGVTSLGTQAFSTNTGMLTYHFRPTTPPTMANTNVFNSIPSDCIIYVPYSADHSILNAYKTASNWSTYASYMQEEPQ